MNKSAFFLYILCFIFVLPCFDSLLFRFSLYQNPIFSHFSFCFAMFWFASVPFLTLSKSHIFTFFFLFCNVLIRFCSISHFTKIPYFHIFLFVLLCFDSLLFRFSLYQDPIFSHFSFCFAMFWFASVPILTLLGSHIFTFLINLFLNKKCVHHKIRPSI